MRCIIVDDEPLAREGMELNVNEVDDLELLGQFSSAMAANDFLTKNEVDLMLLDIQMPGITGLEFLKSLKIKPLVIFTTAYPEYALQGFELDVVDYLVKPVRLHRFIKAVNKARELHHLRSGPPVKGPDGDAFIYLKNERRILKVFLKDIVYIEGQKDYVNVKTVDNSIMTPMNIKTINSQLDSSIFVRVAKSYVINTQYIDEVNQYNVIVNRKEIAIGKTYRSNFMDNYVNGYLLERK